MIISALPASTGAHPEFLFSRSTRSDMTSHHRRAGEAPAPAQLQPTRKDFRAMIFYDFLCQQQSLERLELAFRDLRPSRTTVYYWFAEFKKGRGSLEDEPRDGRPKTAVTPENIDAVRKLVQEDPGINDSEQP